MPQFKTAAPPRRLARLFSRILVGLVAVAVVCGVAGFVLLRTSLPQVTGTLVLPGLEQPVRVVRDPYGVPTITAESRHDLAMALGFVHAQDRLFQMDLQRRAGAGRLSEIFGPAALVTDRTMRTLGLYRFAEAGAGFASPEFRAVLDAYAAGVNGWLHAGAALPIEFTLLGYRPEDWRPADSLVIGKLLALQLTGNYGNELIRARMAQSLTSAEIAELFPGYPQDSPVTLGHLADLTRDLPLDAMLAALPYGAEPQRASNNWVVDGAHSVTGKPLLANDPHLDYAEPIVWYLARLETPDTTLAGATVAGAPAMILGHNDHIAWGYTTTNADAEDLFVEEVDPANPGRYRVPDGSAAFEVRQERIGIKGQEPDTLTIRSTRHGPVISDAARSPTSSGSVLALQASFLVADDRSVEAQWRVGLAGDWASWRDALRLFVAPPQNMVYADRDGHIGFMVPGRIPIRKSGDGRDPVLGSSGDYDWTGFIPFDALPQALDPPVGHIASANNKIVPDDYPYLITQDWDQPFRIARIEAGLAATAKQSIESSTALQGDIVSLAADTLVPLMLASEPRDARARIAMDLLAGWDRRMSLSRPEPLIFSAWLAALDRQLFGPKLAGLYGVAWTAPPLTTAGVLKTHPHWCGEAGCPAALQQSLASALDDLSAEFGPAIDRWRWGDAHQATFDHPVFSRFRVLRSLADRHFPADGSNDTVNAGGFAPGKAAAPFADTHGPGLRAIYDLADLDNSRFELALGQSAHLLSPHYDDLRPLWQRFEGLRLPHGAVGDVLTLLPR